MKTLMHVMIYIYLSQFIFTQNGGLQIAVNQNFFDELKGKFLPDYFSKYQNFSVPNQFMDVGLIVTHLYLNLTNINIQISDLSSDNIHVNLSEPNNIFLKIEKAQFDGNFALDFSIFSILREKDKINFTLNIKELNSIFSLKSVESKIDIGKYLPSFEISSLELDFDLDFDIKGKIFAQLATYFKDKIKSLIKNILISEVKKSIKDESTRIINGFIENNSVFFGFTDEDKMNIGFDYSLTVNPKVLEKMIVFNFNGSFVDLQNKKYLDSSQIPPHDFEVEGKNLQILLSEYSFNSGIFTLELTNQLKFKISTDDFPKNSTLKLDTSLLDIFFKDTSKIYGKDKKVMISCISNGSYDSSGVEISKNNLKIKLEITCQMFIQVADGTQESYEEVMEFITYFNLDAFFKLKEGGIINAAIKNLDVLNSRVIYAKIPGADLYFIEEFVKFFIPIVLPYVNKKFLFEYHIKLPITDGINLEDSLASFEDKFLNLQVNPKIVKEFFNRFLHDFWALTKRNDKLPTIKRRLRFTS